MCRTMEKTTPTTTTKKPEPDEEMPRSGLARRWVRLYRAVPQVNFPGTNLNVSFMLLSAAVLWTVRLCFKFTLINYFGWPADQEVTNEAIGSMTAAFHSIQLVPGLFVALRTQPYRPSEKISNAPQWWQDLVSGKNSVFYLFVCIGQNFILFLTLHLFSALMQMCTGYMIYDSLASIILLHGPNLSPTDYMFLGHHLATTIYMTQTRVIGAGHTSAMICMFLGEFTNPFHNSFLASSHALQLDCCNGPWMQQFNYVMGFFFSFFYVAIRLVIAPIFFLHVTYDLLFSETRKNIGLGNRLFWIFMIWAVEIGSKDWIISCAGLLASYYIHIRSVLHQLSKVARNSEL